MDFKAGKDLQTGRENVSTAEAETLAARAQHATKCLFFLYKTQRIHAKMMKQDGDMRAQLSSLEHQSCYLQKEKWELKKKIPTWSTFSF